MKIYIVYNDCYSIIGIFRSYDNALKKYNELSETVPKESSCYIIEEYMTDD